MKEYQPWNDDWKKSVAYVNLSPKEWTPVRCSETFDYPIFVDFISKTEWPRLMDFWKSVVDTMIYILGHDLENEKQQTYISWLRAYDGHMVSELVAKAKKHLDEAQGAVTAIWMLQAAILMQPDQAEAHYFLGLAFSQHAMRLREEGREREADINFYHAVRYLVNTAELNPRSGQAFYSLGFVFRRLGLEEESRKCLEKYILLGLEDGTYRNRGDVDLGRQLSAPPQ
jgi:tetratricopeptide (TPR) repeat protein